VLKLLFHAEIHFHRGPIQRRALAGATIISQLAWEVPLTNNGGTRSFSAVTENSLLESPLQTEHESLGARMVGFAGWRMPVQYAGIIPEHQATRSACGVFDISHMGQILVEGTQACAWLDRQLTNGVADLQPSECHYTLMLNAHGGVIDDLILYCLEKERFMLIVNASKVDEDDAWLRQHLEEGVSLDNVSSGYAGLAIQGPNTVAIAEKLLPEGLTLPSRNHVNVMTTDHGDTFVCRTGYTGEDGFEIFLPNAGVSDFWQRLMTLSVTPCGLGARDTLRLEMGYPLNGSDLSAERTPLEAGLGFFVDLKKPAFHGRETLIQQKTNGLEHRLTGLVMKGKGPPMRAGYEIYLGESKLGVLASGCLSPSLGHGIGMAYLPVKYAKSGLDLEIAIRERRFPVRTAKKPFYRLEKSS
jgi:aminomethyltransferase